MGLTYTLSMTNLVGPCRRLQNLLTNFCCGLVASSLSPEGCWYHSSALATYSSESMSQLVCPLMPTSNNDYQQWFIIHIYIPIFLPIIQYPMHAIHILMHFKHKLRKCSYNQQDRVLRKTSLFKSFILAWNSFSTQQWV